MVLKQHRAILKANNNNNQFFNLHLINYQVKTMIIRITQYMHQYASVGKRRQSKENHHYKTKIEFLKLNE